jgi:antitoxin PrlF
MNAVTLQKGIIMREVISTVTSKGQVTIPVEMRRHLGVSASDKVAWVKGKGRKLELRPVKYTVEELSGILPPLDRETEDFDDLIEEAMDDAVDQMLES